MKLRAAIFILLFFAFRGISYSQQGQKDLELFDSFTGYNCEDLLARIDAFVVNGIGSNANSIGYLVIHGGSDSVKNRFLERYLIKYRELRKINQNRFVVIPTKAEPDFRIELWLSKNGLEKPLVKEESLSFILPKTNKPMVFVRETVEIVKTDGKWNYVGECAACCIEGFYLDFLAEFLKANPELNADIKLYGKSKDYVNKLDSLVRQEILTGYKISSNRFRIRYAGIDEGIAQLPLNLATIEIDFVPQK